MNLSAHQYFINFLAPAFHGITFRQWTKLIGNRNLHIEFPYYYRLIPTVFKSMINSVLAHIEIKKYENKYKNIAVEKPIFIIGHWRSGTTLLQNIFAHDPRFAYANLYQVTNPYTFLVSEETPVTKLFSLLVPKNRLFDNVPFSLKSPHEDEFIAWHGSGLSPCLGWNFPKQSEYFDKYLTFKECTKEEKKIWRAEFITFYKKLSFKYNKPLVLKSPTHTARIQELLNMFPDARFIHIYRNPYRVHQSTQRLYEFVLKISRFQKHDPQKMHKRILQQYKEMYDVYFEEKNSLPDNRLVEIKFEHFEKNPMKLLESIYKKLELPAFKESENLLADYLISINLHKKNIYPVMDPVLKNEIYNYWERNFKIWGYER